jgi:predicted DNA-binding transcriptional regulator YafY
VPEAVRHLEAVPELVTKREMAQLLTVSVPTFDRMRRRGRETGYPCPEITWGLGNFLRYNPPKVRRWAAALERKEAA